MRLDQFHGLNAGYVLELYERYRQDPASVDPASRAAFETWTPPELRSQEPDGPALPASVSAIVGAANLAESIRRYGHLAAQLDPLGSDPGGDPTLSPAAHGLTDADLQQLPASLVGGPVAERSRNAFEAIDRLRRVYCSTTGFDYAHVFVPEERDWLRHSAESGRFLPAMEPHSAEALLDRLTQVEVFERFLHHAFPGKTRFSVEGVDMLVPMLDEILCNAADQGVRHALLGMAHRGRLNVLAHVLDKPYSQILAEFKDPVRAESWRVDLGWTGDVTYHAGARTSGPSRSAVRDAGCQPEPPGGRESSCCGYGTCRGYACRSAGCIDFPRQSDASHPAPWGRSLPRSGRRRGDPQPLTAPGLRRRRNHPHHREQPAWLHGHPGRVLQHELCERAGARFQDSCRSRQRRRPGGVSRGSANGERVSQSLRARLLDRSGRISKIRP